MPLTLGIIGMSLILVGFLLNQLKIWSQDSVVYDLVNFIGSILLLLYALYGGAWPFVVLNGVWALYSGYDVFRAIVEGKTSSH